VWSFVDFAWLNFRFGMSNSIFWSRPTSVTLPSMSGMFIHLLHLALLIVFELDGVECFRDSDLSQDDFLGRCMIALPMFSTPTTRSFPLRRAAADDVVSGELQLRVEVAPEYFNSTRAKSCFSAALNLKVYALIHAFDSGWGPALDAQLHSLCFKYGFFESISIGSDASSYQSLQNQPAVRRVPTFSVSAPVVALSRTRSRPAMFDSSSSTSQPADGDDEFDIVDRTSVMEKSTVFGRIPVASTPMASEAGPEFDFGADSQPITHMPGCFEKVELHLDQAVLSISGFSIHGRVFLTNFRLIFLPEELFVAESRVSVPDDSSPQNRFDPQFCIVLPFGMLLGVEQSFDSTSFRTPATVIQVQAADFRAFKLMFAHQHHPARVVSLMFRRLRFLSTNPDAPVAFDFIDEFLSRSARVNLSGGHVPFSMSAEMSRLKLPMDLYRMTTLNEHYALCPTYPSELFVPIQFSDAALVDSVKFRSAQRFPVVCWYNAVHGNVMCRSAQPQPGLVSRVNRNDEELIAAYTANTKKLNSEASYFQVFDARSNLAATGNSIAGKGTENMARYANCRIRFLELGNIHTMRASFDALRNMCLSAVSESNWFSALQQSGWLENVRCIINAASTIAQLMHERGVSVLVHCSDGWDRTSQLTSLVQLFMDPYYRTIDGFVTLIEKEWLAFGHMFRKRNGVPEAPDERSPIFAQWLDCVWQCLKQNPDAFEFNEALLLLLADHLRSGWFGTFLMDCERERRAPELRLADRTVSLWVLISGIDLSVLVVIG
jgi:myotubularin-related protein 1/2